MASHNSTSLKAQIDSLLADNTEGGISAQDLRTVTTNLLDAAGGMAVYSNSSATPQSILSSTWTKLTNDGLGAETNEDYLPYYITTPMLSNSTMLLDDIKPYSIVHFRSNVNIVTSVNNQEVRLHLKVYNSSNVEIYDMNVGDYYYKTAGSYELSDHTMFYGNPLLIGAGNYAEIEAYSTDGTFTALLTNIVVRIAG